MDPYQRGVLAADERQTENVAARFMVRAKMFYYALTRPLWNGLLHRKLAPRLKDDPDFRRVDRFLKDEGGMFKEYVYDRVNDLVPLQDAKVLVPGIGYGKNLLQLAMFRPREIVAFDLYEYPEPWRFLEKKLQDEHGVKITFRKGDFGAVPPEDLGSFDAVVSDAVLEHVPDMKAFARGAEAALKEGGIFYASWGPLWYGPGGDHVAWGEGASLYSHLLLDSEEYRKRLATNPQKGDDSCDTGFMLEKELFSYLKSEEYFRELAAAGFEFVDCEAKISPLALKALWEDKDLDAALDRKGAPAFDRYCGGYYLWAKKR